MNSLKLFFVDMCLEQAWKLYRHGLFASFMRSLRLVTNPRQRGGVLVVGYFRYLLKFCWLKTPFSIIGEQLSRITL